MSHSLLSILNKGSAALPLARTRPPGSSFHTTSKIRTSMLASVAFRRSIFLARSARTSFNVSRTGVRSFNPENSALRRHRFQQNGSTTRLNSDQTRAFLNENDNAPNEVPLDLEGSVRKISGKLLRQSADAVKDLSVKCTVTSLVRPDSSLDIAADWVIKDKVGDVIMFWRDVALGALTEHASAEKLESKEGRRGISLVAVKVCCYG